MKFIIIAGSRDIADYPTLKENLDIYFSIGDADHDRENTVIVSGGARGIDALGEKYAKEYGMKTKIIKAKWDKYGKSAGYRRNGEMARIADSLIVFWDGKSKGTRHMIELAHTHKVNVTAFIIIDKGESKEIKE